MGNIRMSGIGKSFGAVAAIDNVSLDIRAGEFLTLLGPSGCGKTTTVRAIAGLADVDTGKIEIGGKDVTLESWIDIVARAADLIGVEHVGIGTDASRKWEDSHLQWVRLGRWGHDPALGRTVSGSDSWPIWPAWFQTPADFPNIADGLRKHGFSEKEMGAILGGNWKRIFGDGFGPRVAGA